MSRILVTFAIVIALSAGSVAVQTPVKLKAFVGARIIDPNGGVPEIGTLMVRDGKIESISKNSRPPQGAEVIDLRGKYLLPGLISAHVHISDVQGLRPPAYTDENTLRQLRLFARYGITSVFSLGGEKEPAFTARRSQDNAQLDRTRIYLAGDVIVGTTSQEARDMVSRVAASKPDIIKIRVDDNLGSTPKMTPEVYRAVIDEAHRRGLRVAAHIYYLEDAKELLRAGADIIAHSVRDKEIDQEFIDLMKKRNAPYIPTLTREISTFIYEGTPAFFSDPFFLSEADPDLVAQLREPQRQEAMRRSRSAQTYKASLVTARKNLKRAWDSGLLVAMGTDAGPFANRFEGYFEHLEMEMMVESGLSTAQVIRASTVNAATALQVPNIGALKKGSWADLLVVDGNPLSDIRATRSISSVWIAGNRVAPK